MSTALLTPVRRTGTTAVQVAPRRYRKQILPKASIVYQGKKIDFDDVMLSNIMLAYQEGAVHQVPWQIADGANKHNNNPELTRGQVVDVERSADGGLDVIMELTADGEKLIKDNPNLGVSARIELGMQRATDGKVFPHVLQHVLGTVNPKVPGLRPWEKVDLAKVEGSTETIDLSAETFDTTEDKMTTTKVEEKDAKVAVELSQEDHAAFLEMLADQKTAKELALSSPDGEDEEPADEGEEEPVDGETPSLALSAEAVAAIELAKSSSDAAAAQVLELANQLRSTQVENELNEFRHQGLAPAVIDLARPLLAMAPQAIELSNGEKVDPGEQARKLLKEVVDLSGTGELVIDLAMENGVAMGGTDSEVSDRQAKLTAWDQENY